MEIKGMDISRWRMKRDRNMAPCLRFLGPKMGSFGNIFSGELIWTEIGSCFWAFFPEDSDVDSGWYFIIVHQHESKFIGGNSATAKHDGKTVTSRWGRFYGMLGRLASKLLTLNGTIHCNNTFSLVIYTAKLYLYIVYCPWPTDYPEISEQLAHWYSNDIPWASINIRVIINDHINISLYNQKFPTTFPITIWMWEKKQTILQSSPFL